MTDEKMILEMDKLARSAFGRTRTEALDQEICVMCSGEAKEFKDEISKKKYEISALCQKCQDEVFKR